MLKDIHTQLSSTLATASSTVKSNYFRFAPIVISLMRKRERLLHTVGIHTIGFIMC